MNRDELYDFMYVSDVPRIVMDGVLAEYDRLTALNAQLLEACLRTNDLILKYNRVFSGQLYREWSDLQKEIVAAIVAAEGEEHA